MAVLSAWLSSRIAPRMERSASRLLGKGLSKVVSVGIVSFYIRLFFAVIARGFAERNTFAQFQWATNFRVEKISRSVPVLGAPVNHTGCGRLRKLLKNFLHFVV